MKGDLKMADYIVSSGEVSSGIILENNSMTVLDGGIANSTTVNNFGKLYVSSGGTATDVMENGGYVDIQTGANVTFIPNSFSGLVLSKSTATLHSGTTANSTIISTNGGMIVYSGGTANNTIVKDRARLIVSSGGTANNTIVRGEGQMSIFSGKISGQLIIEHGALVRCYSDTVFDFDISNRTHEDPALINNLYSIAFSKGATPIYTLTVSETQLAGIYSLADNVYVFEETITVQNTLGEALGSVSLNTPLVIGDTTYTLRLDKSLILTVDAPDRIAPTVSNIQANITALTNQDVVLTADFADDVELAQSLYKLGENGEWTSYSGSITVTENTIVYFKAIDAAGNKSEVASYAVNNIDNVAPETPITTADITDPTGGDVLVTATFSEDSAIREYSLDEENWGPYAGGVLFSSNRTAYFRGIDAAGNISEVASYTVTNIDRSILEKPYTVEYCADNFEHVIRFTVTTPTLDAFRMPSGTYQMRINSKNGEWLSGDPIEAAEIDLSPQLIKSDADGNADVFFVNPVGTWETGYLAQHAGSTADKWGGTKEYAALFGKNKLADIIEGSDDANILLMTDDANGDALFVDDIYTASPGDLAKKQARIARIDEIRAGAGDDIVDMTSQRFEYVGEGLTIRGGAGDDVIWANKGDNFLFGDAGNDRIVGASGDDVIAGGIGNDRMHGGGGNDVFTFCPNWGTDTVEQLDSGSVTLWFVSGSEENWDESSLTYTDGDKSVKVVGVTAEQITLRFGAGTTPEDETQFASLSGMGAFDDFTSERIFEEFGKGMIASL